MIVRPDLPGLQAVPGLGAKPGTRHHKIGWRKTG